MVEIVKLVLEFIERNPKMSAFFVLMGVAALLSMVSILAAVFGHTKVSALSINTGDKKR